MNISWSPPQQTIGPAPKFEVGSEIVAKRFQDGWKELDKRLSDPKCAQLFGGFEKPKKALLETDFGIDTFNGPESADDPLVIHAYTDGKKVRINPQGGFASINGKLRGWRDGTSVSVSFPLGGPGGSITISHEPDLPASNITATAPGGVGGVGGFKGEGGPAGPSGTPGVKATPSSGSDFTCADDPPATWVDGTGFADPSLRLQLTFTPNLSYQP